MRWLSEYVGSVFTPTDVNISKFLHDYYSGKMLLDERDYVSSLASADTSAVFFDKVFKHVDSVVVRIEIESVTAGVPLMRVFFENKSFLMLRGIDSGGKTKGTWVAMAIMRECGCSENQISRCLVNRDVKVYRKMKRGVMSR